MVSTGLRIYLVVWFSKEVLLNFCNRNIFLQTKFITTLKWLRFFFFFFYQKISLNIFTTAFLWDFHIPSQNCTSTGCCLYCSLCLAASTPFFVMCCFFYIYVCVFVCECVSYELVFSLLLIWAVTSYGTCFRVHNEAAAAPNNIIISDMYPVEPLPLRMLHGGCAYEIFKHCPDAAVRRCLLWWFPSRRVVSDCL